MTGAPLAPCRVSCYMGRMSRKPSFQVKSAICETCIYRADLAWNLKKLEDDVRDTYIGFKSYRECHKRGSGVCCRGFWNAHKDEFASGQVAQRLNLVEFVE